MWCDVRLQLRRQSGQPQLWLMPERPDQVGKARSTTPTLRFRGEHPTPQAARAQLLLWLANYVVQVFEVVETGGAKAAVVTLDHNGQIRQITHPLPADYEQLPERQSGTENDTTRKATADMLASKICDVVMHDYLAPSA